MDFVSSTKRIDSDKSLLTCLAEPGMTRIQVIISVLRSICSTQAPPPRASERACDQSAWVAGSPVPTATNYAQEVAVRREAMLAHGRLGPRARNDGIRRHFGVSRLDLLDHTVAPYEVPAQQESRVYVPLPGGNRSKNGVCVLDQAELVFERGVAGADLQTNPGPG